MTRDDERIDHIVEAAARIEEIVARGREVFDEDHTTRAALTHYIQVVGEASVRLSEVARSRYPDVPWQEIIGMRNIIVHGYSDVDLEMIWRTAVLAVPQLRRQLGG